MAKNKRLNVNRRGFLKGAATGAAATAVGGVVSGSGAEAQEQIAQRNATAQPNAATLAADTGVRPVVALRIVEKPGSDFMVDVLKTLDLEYVAANPGSTFEGLHESLINYGDNKMPELLTCCHEESAVAMAHGYAKIEGKPMMALIHGTIGIQHASMAIYNAYADRVPVYMVVGDHADGAERSSGVQSLHSAQDIGALVRDFVKWDDQPYSLGHFAESAVRAYNIALTPPMAPVLITMAAELQLHPNTQPGLRIPKLSRTSPPQGESGAVAEAAKMLVNAERPMIMTERTARTPEGMKLMIELAETLQSPVRNSERMDFPNRHPLAGTGFANYDPDVTICLEVNDVSNTARAARARNAKTISVSSIDLSHKANIQEFGKYSEVDLDIGADGQATLPALIEQCKKLITPDRRRAMQERGAKIAAAHKEARKRNIELASVGWDASPVSLNRLCAELWPQIKDLDWSLVSWQGFISGWPGRLWNFDKHYQYIGGQGAGGMGYGAPAAVGAALANKKHGRFSVSIQTDGDLNYAPGVLWTAAHHRIPLLTIMHNNRGYHQEVMFIEQAASVRNRGAERAHIGTKLWDPDINYAKMAQAYGMEGFGPITDPKDLAPTFRKAIEIVRKGEPAMIDVVTQPR
ncbi:MAG TPA: thiamine pyrophosphate-dependent enzyme [Bryobacteraceae bacterium]|jgi:thiamine pyrophosphate-dependent acetolactate synthase large subunit-like protein|nr:thiamine pyrophosphate-dependent enzyme [Bryobacteraceae bacterium]